MGNWTPEQVKRIKGMSSISNPYLARAAEAVGYPAREEFSMFATAVRDAVLDALIAEAEEEDVCIVRLFSSPGTYLVQKGDDLADWLRAKAQEAVPEPVAESDAAGAGG